jgi:hypothetical protein
MESNEYWGHTQGGKRSLLRCNTFSPTPNLKLKTTDFVHIISNVLHDLPSSQNQMLKLADV